MAEVFPNDTALYLLFAVEFNDVAAFVTGKLFGRHPLRSNISPKKTWEGSLGALAVSLALPWALRFTFPHFDAIDLIAIGSRKNVARPPTSWTRCRPSSPWPRQQWHQLCCGRPVRSGGRLVH